jgi:hypothetical protein
MKMSMSDQLVFPLRTIHLDFHTGPQVTDVGKDFNPQQFAQTFKDALVDSVTVFAKCHHGLLYYDTNHPARHPSLPRDLDLLGEQVKALHGAGIRAPIYLSIQCDEYAANTHPEWIALTPELRHVKRGGSAYQAGWQIMDMSSPYQDYVADQIDEVLRKFAPVDGLFLDMCWDQPSSSKWAIDGMKKKGLDPREETDREKYARMVAHEYMARFRDMLENAQKGHAPAGVWFNSRPKTNLHVEKKFLRHVEIEALPTGGWGYAYFPYVARFVRPLGLPTLSHTGRFHKSWGDNGGLKPHTALSYECAQILSQGLTLGVGDLLHPRGVPHPEVYQLIGSVYRHIAACQPFVVGAKHLSEVALVVNPDLGDNPGPSGLGAVRALQQLRQQFDVVPPDTDFASYRLVIIPETTRVDSDLRASLQTYLKNSGALILSGQAGLEESGQAALPEMGIEVHGLSPYTHTFMRASDEVRLGLPEFDFVMYEQGYRMTPTSGARSLVQVVEPYFQRSYDHFSGHEYTPPNQVSPYAAAIQNGRVITFSVPLLEAFGKHASLAYRQILGNCIALLLPDPLIRDQGPAHLEATAVRRDQTTIIHLISFLPSRQAENLDIVHDPFPLVNMPISIRLDAAPSRLTLQPAGLELHFTYSDGYAHTTVTLLDGHAMLVFE